MRIVEDSSLVLHVRDADGVLLAMIVRANFSVDGLSFLTDDSSVLQVGCMTRPTGETIAAHIHEPLMRNILGTQEVLVIQSGKIRLDLFTQRQDYVESVMLETGDLALLSEGGHGIHVIEEARIIEIKQGPFAEGKDKTRFEPVLIESPDHSDTI